MEAADRTTVVPVGLVDQVVALARTMVRLEVLEIHQALPPRKGIMEEQPLLTRMAVVAEAVVLPLLALTEALGPLLAVPAVREH